MTRCSIPVILNRGPHGPPRGEFTSLGGGGIQSIWGGMDPFGGNQQIAINSPGPGCSSGWRIVAASCTSPLSPAHNHRHRALWAQCPDQNGHWAYEGQHFWLRGIHTSDKNGNALPAQRISKFPSKFGS